jgi:hypothetical protein
MANPLQKYRKIGNFADAIEKPLSFPPTILTLTP